ncbi:MAG: hypothetical protein N2044_11755 [Cyclobacteriaceae bacterium]|nr:hypothetical protein [Cyclobacteriaceae bacterium]MCX7638509.1 hypothetical protein [Cyclobacteriaceae bacterium]MDW8331977.1 YkoF family thiamine/hydroxymethylpyrimidine-binding protein [Cyclobacteriaceae bacterium]
MKATFEISLYPLHNEYQDIVLAFLKDLNAFPGIKVETNGMSTQVFGELDELFTIMNALSKKYLEHYRAVLVFKIGKGHLRYEP